MPFTKVSGRITDPKKLPMEELHLIADTLANAILDEEDDKVIVLLDSLVEQYMNIHFKWEFSIKHSPLGHTTVLVCTHEDGFTTDFHSEYHKASKHKDLRTFGTYVLRDILYHMTFANLRMGDHLFFKDKEKFDLLENATFTELLEEF